MLKIDKKVKLELVGLDGNAFALMGAFKTAARRQGWTAEEIEVVVDQHDEDNAEAVLEE